MGWGGVSDPDSLDLEQVHIRLGRVVKPSNGLDVLCARFGHDPDGGGGFVGGEIGKQLSQVIVVAPLQLVLDDDSATIIVLGDEVDGECTGSLLAFGVGQGRLQVFV